MLEEFAKQIQRLFSSKSNGGKLVHSATNKLHRYKQILLATSIILLLGYSQFRAHFQCDGTDRVDPEAVTHFCWINGTTTVNRIRGSEAAKERPSRIVADGGQMGGIKLAPGSRILDQIVPHIGIQFRYNEGKYELVNHNYMRSLWALLMLLLVCSYIATKKWAEIFSDDLMKALLQLPGSEELPIVKKAQDINGYQLLTKQAQIDHHQQSTKLEGNLRDIFACGQDKGQVFVQKIDILLGDENEHNHTLDYYSNQLIYLLLPRKPTSYRLPNMKLRQKLLNYSFCSLMMTCMQFLLPWSFIGNQYTLYGWNFALLALEQLYEQIRAYPHSSQVNSWDYELTSAIWPTSTQCEYKKFSLQGMQRINVQCTVPINEICGKLFFIIWWFVMVNIIIELWSFLELLFCSINFETIQWTFGRRFWPNNQESAKIISTFRYRRSNLLAKIEAEMDEQRLMESEMSEDSNEGTGDLKSQILRTASNIARPGIGRQPQATGRQALTISDKDRKHLEAELEKSSSSRRGRGDATRTLSANDHTLDYTYDDMSNLRGDTSFGENKQDSDLYYLLYLLYLRLNCSRKKVEQVIEMTSEALACYLDRLEWSNVQSVGRSGPISSSSTTSTTIVPSVSSMLPASGQVNQQQNQQQQQE